MNKTKDKSCIDSQRNFNNLYISSKINFVWERERERQTYFKYRRRAKNGRYCFFFGFCLVALGSCGRLVREEANTEEAKFWVL